jgi:hypothetical protein
MDIPQKPHGLIKYLIMLVLAALFVYLGALAKNEIKNGGRGSLPKDTISVSADAKRSVKPDTAELSFTVRKENALLATARDQAAAASQKVVDYLKGAGVEEKNIKSTAFNIYPQEVYDSRPCILESGTSVACPPRKTVKTYVVEETFDVKIKNLDKAGEIITGVSNVGVNQVGALQFTVDDATLEKVRLELRDEAIQKAKEKSKALAKTLSIRLGDLVGFSENGNAPIYYQKYGIGGGSDVASSPTPAITPGENEISASISLTYEIP